ncbi:hypothetical protein D0S48_01440 [Psychrobacillus sp. AK 1817]|nr:hypothetical protein D0S48_01440 [Psychrobacillus sp. AK 1817]
MEVGVKTVSFQHEGDKLEKDINEFYYKATISVIKQSFNLNLDHTLIYVSSIPMKIKIFILEKKAIRNLTQLNYFLKKCSA